MSDVIPEVKAAAAWWADRLRGIPKFDNGDPSPQGGMATMLAMMGRAETKITEEQIETFRAALEAQLMPRCTGEWWRPDQPDYGSGGRCIGVDYHPDPELDIALQKAGIIDNMMTLPWKTYLWINPGCVKVRHGYSARVEVIYGQDKAATKGD